jgi:heptaprenyl diphosphate synthase
MSKSKRLAWMGIMVAVALMIHIVEARIPVLSPGIKLGLANSVSLFALLAIGWKEAFMIAFLRIVLGSMFGGSISAFLFSMAGAFLSNIVMIFLYYRCKENISVSFISMAGAIFHNIGQLFMGSMIIKNFRLYLYLPVLLISAIITGFFIGVCTDLVYRHLHKIGLLGQKRGT